jgi:hypothetical protein
MFETGTELNYKFEHISKEIRKDKESILRDHSILATLNGEMVGRFTFIQSENKESSQNWIEALFLSVSHDYREKGLSLLLIREFGAIYERYFNGYRIRLLFINPIGEYTFRKALSLGLIPGFTINESKVIRSYEVGTDTNNMNESELKQYIENRRLWSELRGKLPEKFRGKEKSGSYYSY